MFPLSQKYFVQLDRSGPAVSLDAGVDLLAAPLMVDLLYAEPVTAAAFDLATYQLTIASGPDVGTVIEPSSLEILGDQQVRSHFGSMRCGVSTTCWTSVAESRISMRR